MAIPISNVTRRAVYAPTGAGGAGPYAFTFEILAATDIAVYKDDVLLTLTTHYTVTINANGTGSVTITAAGLALAPTSPTQYAIVGNRTISRSTDFTTGGDFFANTLNDELDQQTIFNQQNAEGLGRALQAPQTDPTSINMTLPRSSVRANKTLAFDANGDPTTGEVIGDNRGNWASGTAYNKRDIIKDTSNGNVYYANTSHTSSGSQPISTNADLAKWDLLVDNASASSSATAAAASASAAATSASNASTSASNAASSASTASTQASNASTSASNASTSATNAASSASSASSSASTATTQATNASNSASAAATSATNASNSASTATTQATNAATSATNASNSASNASTSATNASNSASAASTSATNAASSATAAASAQTAAEAARDQTLASFDSFDDRYLGAKTSDPTLDNDGNALITGALYFNSVAAEMRVYTGTTWLVAYLPATGYLALTGGTLTGPVVMNVNSSSDALKITQTGSGNALYIEDVAADATPFVVSSTGVVGIGTTTPDNVTSAGIALVSNSGFYPQLVQRNTTADANASYVVLEKNRNGAVVQNGDVLGNLAFRGYDGANYLQGAYINAVVSAAPGTNDMPTDLVLGTTADGSSGPSERVRVTQAGSVGIGTASPAERLSVAGSVVVTGSYKLSTWSITESGGVLYFAVGGVNKAKLDGSGNLTVTGNVTAYGTM